MTEEEKREAYVRMVFAGNDGDVFTRGDLRAYIEEAWSAGYDEGARDFGDTVSVSPFTEFAFLPRWQADKLTEKLEAINQICDKSTCSEELRSLLLQDIEREVEQSIPQDLPGMAEYWGNKLKLLRLKSNEQTDGQQQSNH